MRLATWISQSLHRAIDVDGVYGAQCVDLVNDYLARVRATARVHGNAVDIIHQPVAGAVWVLNGPYNAPSAGDVVVWSNGAYGHTAIALAADASSLVSLDQNWAGVQRAEVVGHTYAGVAGWHHFFKEPGP